MERPGLKRLLADIERGLIEIVVVYKIDRLTCSLVDCSRMVVGCGSEYRTALPRVAGFLRTYVPQCKGTESSRRTAASVLRNVVLVYSHQCFLKYRK
ncbi:hypothetical protein KR96_22865 [Ralstonia solanacearum]|nr:hypothetical protein KR96_22865 [Ralstonia solanacearum]